MGKWPILLTFGSLVTCPLLGDTGNSTPATSELQARPKRAPHNQGCAFRNEVRRRKPRALRRQAHRGAAGGLHHQVDVASRADAPQPAREQELTGAKTGAR